MIIMKRSLRSFSVSLLATATLCLAFPSQNLLAQCDTAGTIFGGGTGTELDPYQICSIDQLNRIRDNSGGENYLNDHFVLTKDLDFEDTDGSGTDYVYSDNSDENAKGWLPIGHDTNKNSGGFQGTVFTGTFDGDGHVIRNLFIARADEDDVGLFGQIISVSLKNLGVEGQQIRGGSSVGGIAGFNRGQITSCYSTGVVMGSTDVGGLMGRNGGEAISCYSTGAVTGAAGSMHVGGFAGVNLNTITSCYSTGAVAGGTGSTGVGGFIGMETGPLTTMSYWDTQASGNADSASGAPKDTTEMKALTGAEDSSGWGELSWHFGDTNQYPALRTYEVNDSNEQVQGRLICGQPSDHFQCPALNFGDEMIAAQTYTKDTTIPALALPAAVEEGMGTLTYSLTPDLPAGLMFVPATRTLSGIPSAGSPVATYTYTVIDSVAPPQTATLTFTIIVIDSAAPVFSVTTIADQTYAENTEIDDLVLPVATDTGTVTYSLVPVPAGLAFDPATRTLSGTPTIPQSASPHTYTAADDESNAVTLIFMITVLDTTAPDFAGATIDDQTYTVNTAITDLVLPPATDTGIVTYSLNPALPSGLIPAGAVTDVADPPTISGIPDTTSATMTYTYTAKDNATTPNTQTLTFMITVLADTTAPDFAGATIDDQTYTVNTAITDLVLPPATDTGIVTYSLSPALPSGLIPAGAVTDVADPPTISGIPDTTSATMTYTYTAKDNATTPNTQTLTFMITVLADTTAPDFAGATIDDQTYTKDTAITPLTLPAATDTGTVTYSLSPALPSGLTPAGAVTDVATPPTISGIPDTTFATMTYTYTATDNAATPNTQTLMFTITVEDPPPGTPTFAETVSDQTYTQNTAITDLVLPVATGGMGALTYTLTPVPAGLMFDEDPASRTLSGTPTTTTDTATTHTYTVTDSTPDTALTETLTFMITVNAEGTLSFSGTVPNQTYTQNTAITDLELPVATGGMGPYMYTLVPVPAGLMFDATTRTLSGMPTAVTDTATTHTYTVTDSTTDTALTKTLTFTITVNEEGSPTFAETVANQTYTQNTAIRDLELPVATGGMGALTYALTPVPDGLEFDATTRTLSGTPTTTTDTATTHTYTVTDSTPDTALTASLTFTITVSEEAEPTFGIGSQGAAVHVYPNPAGDVLHIEFPGADEYGIALLTVTGQPVLGERHVGGGAQTLDLSSLTRGVYFLKIEDSEGVSHTFRIIR